MYNRAIVTNFDICTLPMKHEAAAAALLQQDGNVGNIEPRLFGGIFTAKTGIDAFLQFRCAGMNKGIVFVNGFNLGRYWAIGPQDTLYISGELLHEVNTIEVFELYSDGVYPKPVFSAAHELDSIKTNAELVLAPRA
jgi:hypothetical protein